MLASPFGCGKLHTEQMSEASLGLSGVAICLSPTLTNQLPQLGLEIKCRERLTANRKRETKKTFKNPFKNNIFTSG